MADKLPGILGLVGSLAGALTGKWARKLRKLQATANELEALENVGDRTPPVPLISELQVTVKGKSGDEFTAKQIVWEKTKAGRVRR